MLNEAKVLKMIQAQKKKKQKGASMIEYALVVAGVAAIAAVVFATDGDVATSIETKVKNAVTGTTTSG